jgi:hypothetical protein
LLWILEFRFNQYLNIKMFQLQFTTMGENLDFILKIMPTIFKKNIYKQAWLHDFMLDGVHIL